MQFVIPFTIISDGISGLIPMTDILICIEQKLHHHDGLSRGGTLSSKTDAFSGNVSR